jgi:hypothetical protein
LLAVHLPRCQIAFDCLAESYAKSIPVTARKMLPKTAAANFRQGDVNEISNTVLEY